jgi:hypothetical protein
MEDLLKEGPKANQEKNTLMENITVYIIKTMMTRMIMSKMMIISNTL